MHVLLIGGGYVATETARRLVAEGDTVCIVRRNPDLSLPYPQLAGDILDPATWGRLPGPFDAAVYSISPDRGDEEMYRKAWETGVRAALEALEERGDPLRRFVLLTSTGVYAERDGAVVDEDSPLEATQFRGVWPQRGEALLNECPFEGVSLRLGGIYGPGRTGFLRRIQSGSARMPRGPRYSNRIHRDDAAQAALHCLRLPSVPPVLNGVDQAPAELREVMTFAAELLGVPPPPLEDPDVDRPLGKRVSAARLEATGFAWQYPSYKEGYRALQEATPSA